METKTRGLGDLLERGGVIRDLEGGTPREVLTSLVRSLPPALPLPPDRLLEAVLERESLMSTGIGRGVALPHPRNPLVSGEGGEFSALAFSRRPVDWKALDGEPVDTLFLIVSASAKQHLRVLSEITFFCRQEKFCKLLKERAASEDILRFIREAENNWQ